ncbi:hypothetical protein JCM12296A_19530 [Desulfosarcina cetonica]|uniref:hypothetical protein n=1 Tax=Desulfosarcina cetonica TaxID=90730 RepID=UPI0006D140E9|nr:hypothetical protein [Desulfosarcina cetonica]
MKPEKENPAWTRICFLLSPEDSSTPAGGLPVGVGPSCCRIKALFWVVVSVVGAILLGQL